MQRDVKERLMEIIRSILSSILSSIHCLLCCVAEKVSKKEYRTCAVVLVGSIAIAAVAFSFHGLEGSGKNDVYAAAEQEEPPAEEEQEEALSGVGAIISGVLVTQNTNNEVGRIGTSNERVLVGQRSSKQVKESSISVGEEVVSSVENLGEHSLEAVKNDTRMSDRDYETLLAIVEAEAGGEDMKGRILVANVIFNRVSDERFPETVTDVVWEKVNGKAQFSPTIDGRIGTVTVSDTTREAVNRAIDGEDYSRGALFFLSKDHSEKNNVAWFEKDLKELFSYGVHDFYTLPDR